MAVATVFKSQEDISPEWIAYIQVEAEALSRMSDLEIESYSDREAYNPDVQAFLLKWQDDGPDYVLNPSFRPVIFSYTYPDKVAEAGQVFRIRLRRLKEKVRRVLCRILREIGGDDQFDWKAIITAVLVALVPVLGGGIWAVVVVPILVTLIAKLAKYGMDTVCPV